ncbi:hypothetical protein Pint_19377 [Pistacia integerrima]|uniref:Uncharacterized protein n=1 Tax=Pistacia integerrima TaxID=434235 RepID=A0ACC0Z135_9ROSI|nr:hypothetical protein Pint_19377 [Pistacia integerrima]
MNGSSFKSSLDLNPRRDDDDDDQRKSKVDDYKIKLPAPSFRRLFVLNLPERKQASLGCLSAILSGAVQPFYSFIIGSTLPKFLANAATFIGSYVVGFLMSWRLTIVIFPTALLLVITGMICGRAVMDLARKMAAEYNKAGTIAEQAISSIRTVYSFVGETKTINDFSSALESLVNLGVKQGLAKGWAVGSNIIYAIWSFLAYYDGRMVMCHGAKGGTVYAVAAAIAVGGQALGPGLSRLKSISEAMSAGELVKEAIKRIPNIDSDNLEGQVLENVSGEVEFRHPAVGDGFAAPLVLFLTSKLMNNIGSASTSNLDLFTHNIQKV